MSRSSHYFFPGLGTKHSSLHKSVIGSGYGAVLLDGGMGGQSSYPDLDTYYETTNIKKTGKYPTKGEGLSDKIASKLSKLKIDSKGPKRKNITLSI